MSKNLDPEFSERKIAPYYKKLQSSSSDIKNSDLELITQALAERTYRSESIDEIKKIVEILPNIEEAKVIRTRNDLDIIRIEEARLQADFERKMVERKEFVKVAASFTAVGLGVYFMPTAPLFAPFVIILGIASLLQYTLREVGDLWERMVNSTKSLPPELLSPDEKINNQSKNIDDNLNKL